MDPLTIGALAVAAGKAAYSIYKSSTAKSPSGGGGMTTGDSLARLRGMQTGSEQPQAPAAVAAPIPYQVAPQAMQQTQPVPGAPPQPLDPMARLRAMGGG